MWTGQCLQPAAVDWLLFPDICRENGLRGRIGGTHEGRGMADRRGAEVKENLIIAAFIA